MPATDKTTLTLELAYITARDECLDHSKVFVRPASATTASSLRDGLVFRDPPATNSRKSTPGPSPTRSVGKGAAARALIIAYKVGTGANRRCGFARRIAATPRPRPARTRHSAWATTFAPRDSKRRSHFQNMSLSFSER